MAANLKFLKYISYSKPGGKGANPKAISMAKEAIKYVEANREHHRNNPHLFTAKEDHADRRPFMRRIEDQKQYGAALFKWKLGVSEQERDELKLDYKEWTREFMARVEAKYRVKLDWVAGIHDDAGHPHIHILIRGKDKEGNHVNFYSYDISKLNKLAEETKRLQAIRNLGPEQAERTMERLEQIATERQQRKTELGIPKDQPIVPELIQGVGTAIGAAMREADRADRERERAQAQFNRRQQRKSEREKRKRERGGMER